MEQDSMPQVVKEDMFSQDHMQELKRRGDSQKYFEGAGDFRSGEGFGYLVGGGLSIIMGAFIFPIIMSGHSDSGIENYLFPALTLAGIFLAVKGIFLMRKEDKTPRLPISDERFDEIMAYDSQKAKKQAEQALVDAYGISPDSEFIHLIGPNYYTANRHIPLLWRVDQTGKIRYSNFALVTLVFEEDAAYSHTCILNHRDGIVSKSHPYRYSLEEIKELLIEDREVERLTSEHKIEEKQVSMMMIRIAGKEDINELSVILADHEIEKKTGGHFDDSQSRATAELIKARISKKIEQREEEEKTD